MPQIAEEEESRLFRPSHELGAFLPDGGDYARPVANRMWMRRDAVLLRERRELLNMSSALLGERVAQVVQVMLDGVPLGDLSEPPGELTLGVMDIFDCLAQLHVCSAPAILLTRTAATLKNGCSETGSHSVMVSSLAARECPSGPEASGRRPRT
jgi:hypothetical protein